LNIPVNPTVDTQFGIDFLTSDDDDGGNRGNAIAWNMTADRGWFSPSVFGIGVLKKQTTPTPTGTNTLTPTHTNTPTKTNTPIPATPTNTSTLPAPTPTQTNTPIPATPTPTNTSTLPAPTPTKTNTPIPAAPTPTNTSTLPAPTPMPTKTATPPTQPTQTSTPTSPGGTIRMLYLPIVANSYPLKNNTRCTAHRITPPTTVSQPADNVFILYLLTATKTDYNAVLKNYDSTGKILVYRVDLNHCLTDGTMVQTLIGGTDIDVGSPNFSADFAGFFVPGRDFLIVIYTTGDLTSAPYTLEIK
jgi:hypothetical protein